MRVVKGVAEDRPEAGLQSPGGVSVLGGAMEKEEGGGSGGGHPTA